MTGVAAASGEHVIAREPLRDQVRRNVLRRILQSELSAGANLNEAQLAEDMGVSRTPVREALMQLQQEGFLVSEPGRGCFVAPLTAHEVRDLFSLIGSLEEQAIRWSGPPDRAAIRELESLNDRLAVVDDDPETALELNSQWHQLLVAHCENKRLRELIHQLRQQAYRYEYNYFLQGAARTGTSVELHRGITTPLKKGDIEGTCRAITRHWWTDLDLMLPHMPEHDPS